MKTGSGKKNTASFAPILSLDNVADAIQSYKKAFSAKELRRWSNDDGSVHVAEMMIEDALFHLHEEVSKDANLSPKTLRGTCVILGLFVADPDEVVSKAIAAGATEIYPIQEKFILYKIMTMVTGRGISGIHLVITGQSKKVFEKNVY